MYSKNHGVNADPYKNKTEGNHSAPFRQPKIQGRDGPSNYGSSSNGSSTTATPIHVPAENSRPPRGSAWDNDNIEMDDDTFHTGYQQNIGRAKSQGGESWKNRDPESNALWKQSSSIRERLAQQSAGKASDSKAAKASTAEADKYERSRREAEERRLDAAKRAETSRTQRVARELKEEKQKFEEAKKKRELAAAEDERKLNDPDRLTLADEADQALHPKRNRTVSGTGKAKIRGLNGKDPFVIKSSSQGKRTASDDEDIPKPPKRRKDQQRGEVIDLDSSPEKPAGKVSLEKLLAARADRLIELDDDDDEDDEDAYSQQTVGESRLGSLNLEYDTLLEMREDKLPDPDTLCPFCDQPFPSDPTPALQYLKEYLLDRPHIRDNPRARNPKGKLLPAVERANFCKRHVDETTVIPEGKAKGYPSTIDWDGLEKRIRSLRTALTEIILGVRSSEFFTNAKLEWEEKGVRKMGNILNEIGTYEVEQPGYYGRRGYELIVHSLTRLFVEDVQTLTAREARPLDVDAYIRRVLVPETAIALIQADKDCSREEAIEIRQESAAFGRAMFRDSKEDQEFEQAQKEKADAEAKRERDKVEARKAAEAEREATRESKRAEKDQLARIEAQRKLNALQTIEDDGPTASTSSSGLRKPKRAADNSAAHPKTELRKPKKAALSESQEKRNDGWRRNMRESGSDSDEPTTSSKSKARHSSSEENDARVAQRNEMTAGEKAAETKRKKAAKTKEQETARKKRDREKAFQPMQLDSD